MQTATVGTETASRLLADYTSVESICLGLEGRTAAAVLEELVRALHLTAGAAEVLRAGVSALNLELLTGVTDSVAIAAPVRVPGEMRPRFALGRAREPLAWRAGPLTPIEFVILLVEPSPAKDEGRQVLAACTRLSRDRDRLEELRAASTAGDMLAVLARLPILANERATALPASPLGPEAKQAIALDGLERGGQGRRHWRGSRSAVPRP